MTHKFSVLRFHAIQYKKGAIQNSSVKFFEKQEPNPDQFGALKISQWSYVDVEAGFTD